MNVRFSLFLTLLLALAACSEPVPDKTPTEPVEPTQDELFKADMVVICDSVKRPEIAQASEEDRSRIAAKYIASNIRSDRANKLFEALTMLAPDDRVGALNLAAADAGLQECAFVGLFLPPPQEDAVDAPAPAAQPEGAGLSKDAISKVVQAHRNEIRLCFEKGLMSNPELKGQVVVMFMIEISGMVSTTDVSETTLSDDAIEACVLNEFRLLRFPSASRRTAVKYPINFSPPRR